MYVLYTKYQGLVTERNLLKSQQQSTRLQHEARKRKKRTKLIKVQDKIRAFDPAGNSHPDVYGIVEPNEVWRPTVAPRPLPVEEVTGHLPLSGVSSVHYNAKMSKNVPNKFG